MTVTVLRMFVKKQDPICIHYRDYKNYNCLAFHDELSQKLSNVLPENLSYETFQNTFMDVLNRHAKVKKKIKNS